MKKLLYIMYMLIVITSCLMMFGCSNDQTLHRRHFFRMNTIAEITIVAPKNYNIDPVWRDVDSILRRSEKLFSVSGEYSEVRVLNERGDVAAMPVSFELCEMIRAGINYGDTLGGAFDITVLPLKKLWGFCEECSGDEPIPTQEQIDYALRNVDYRAITVNESCDTVFFASPDVRVDVGGVAKGFVLKRVARHLESNYGLYDYLITIGGDIFAGGVKRRGVTNPPWGDGDDADPWTVGVRNPRDASSLVETFPLRGGEMMSVVTSGDYERYRIVDGERYHHIFNTQTGRSCNVNQSVSVRARDPVVADILSTGLFCFSADEIEKFVEDRNHIGVIVVDSSGLLKSFRNMN